MMLDSLIAISGYSHLSDHIAVAVPAAPPLCLPNVYILPCCTVDQQIKLDFH